MSKLEEVYELYANQLYRISLTYLGDSHSAQDVVHDAYIKYAKTPRLFLNASHQQAWFIRVVINLCHDYTRKNNRLEYKEHFDDYATQEESLFYTLSLLPENYRIVIILHHLEGYSIKEVAQMLKLGESAVKMRLKRGKEKLKTIMEDNNHV